MAYTQEDLTTVQNAKLQLATGQAVQRLRIAGKEFEFSPADMTALQALEAEIMAGLGQDPPVALRTYARIGGR